MRCRKVRSFLSTYCKDELDPDVSGEITRHLDDCKACRREAEAFRSINRMLDQMPVYKTGDDFTAKLFARIGSENIAEKRSKAFFPRRVPIFGITRLATVSEIQKSPVARSKATRRR